MFRYLDGHLIITTTKQTLNCIYLSGIGPDREHTKVLISARLSYSNCTHPVVKNTSSLYLYQLMLLSLLFSHALILSSIFSFPPISLHLRKMHPFIFYPLHFCQLPSLLFISNYLFQSFPIFGPFLRNLSCK